MEKKNSLQNIELDVHDCTIDQLYEIADDAQHRYNEARRELGLVAEELVSRFGRAALMGEDKDYSEA